MKPDQEISHNGITATIRQTADGGQELIGDAFIEELIRIGFRAGRNDSPERIEEILKNVPEQYRQAFLDGVNGK